MLTVLVGVSLVGSGLGVWRARPENRVGRIMVFTGFAWFAAQLVEARAPWVYTIGLVVQSVFIVGFVYLLLSFPSGRLPTVVDRGSVVVGAVLTVGLQALAMLYGDRSGLGCPSCTDNLLRVFTNNTLASGLLSLQRFLGGLLIIFVIGWLVWRWLRASTPERRAVAPVLVAGLATLSALSWDIVEDLSGNPFGALPATVFQYTFAAVPVAVLVVFLQRRLARGMVAGLVVELGRPSVSANLSEALARLGDPSLELAFWFPAENCYVDADGGPVTLPDDATKRSSTFVERVGNRSPSSCTTLCSSTTRSWCAPFAPRQAWPSRTSASRRSYAPSWSNCRLRGSGWSRRPIPNAGALSVTSTTAPSSDWSRSPCPWACSRPSSPSRRPRCSR